MAYADQKQNRTVAIGSVALVHLGLGAALLTGFAVKFAPPPEGTLETRNIPVELPPDPVEPPPQPREEVAERPTTPTETIVVPIPPVPRPSTVDLTTTTLPQPEPPIFRVTAPQPPAQPPQPPAVNLSRGIQPRGDQGAWFPQDSYPAAARRAGAEGRVSVSVDVGTGGRVTACRVTASSGNEDLDAATCRLATRNGRFEPARNETGQPTAGTVTLRPVRWRLEE